jgi:hypothetical protein
MSMRIRSEHITQGELADEIGNNLVSAIAGEYIAVETTKLIPIVPTATV